MEKVNRTIELYAQILTFLAVWFLALIVVAPIDFLGALKLVPTTITIYAFIGIIFVKWVWRWSIFQGWLIKIPDLQGTWRGELKSDWINPETNENIPSVQVVLVIRQTFSSIDCTLMTQESNSYSTTASINTANNGRDLYLTYNYTNRPRATLRDKSEIHDGAAILKIIKHPERGLEGEYWTSRKTRGDLVFKFESQSLAERFS